MKNIKLLISFFLVFLLLAGTIQSQDKKQPPSSVKPPAAASQSFLKSFPGSTNVKWEKEGNDYEVNFTLNSKNMSAVYTGSGKLKETEVVIKSEELPAAAVNYMNSHYKGLKISEASRITKSGGEVNYEARVNQTDLVFNEEGKFIRTEKE